MVRFYHPLDLFPPVPIPVILAELFEISTLVNHKYNSGFWEFQFSTINGLSVTNFNLFIFISVV